MAGPWVPPAIQNLFGNHPTPTNWWAPRVPTQNWWDQNTIAQGLFGGAMPAHDPTFSDYAFSGYGGQGGALLNLPTPTLANVHGIRSTVAAGATPVVAPTGQEHGGIGNTPPYPGATPKPPGAPVAQTGRGAGSSGGGGAGGGGDALSRWRDSIDKALGAGWFDRFTTAHGMTPIEFYADPRNQFPFQRDIDPTDVEAVARGAASAAIQEGQYHQMEIADWQQKHGNTPIPQEQWERWYAINRSGGPRNVQGVNAGYDAYGVR